ncbi:MAG TPA: 3-oxoacyl-[acyl-carrier-protein] reductase [Thermotogota bacterium]|nr:3-oxoacyl-[acyl-carrier-protein] reductase [Thermotogota bacterium]HPJ89028.1 3-oxoacyl-[acyl-carrier-protein] reductase [Thermotogota bacterium]HPR95539.1 3-oxoacyl-[acyl-carrier-protein] reductase [Thermotogota bacterium]
MNVKDKVCLVTGGARGIGRETALLFARNGANVAVCDVLDEDLKLLEADAAGLEGRVKAFHLDVTNREEIETVLKAVEEEFGRLDILINNAGITRDAFLMKMTEDQWDKVIDVNLKGVFNMTQACSRMMKQEGGVVLSTSSVVGVYGNIGQTNYAATKSGLIGMTYTWAKELARYKIRVNAVAPGFIQTPMTKDLPQKVLDYMTEKTPLKMIGDPIDIANAFLFLASEEARYITGQVLGVDGGLVI